MKDVFGQRPLAKTFNLPLNHHIAGVAFIVEGLAGRISDHTVFVILDGFCEFLRKFFDAGFFTVGGVAEDNDFEDHYCNNFDLGIEVVKRVARRSVGLPL
jgi:hypothetical protein